MSRNLSAKTADSPVEPGQFISLFPTELGWMGIVGRVNVVRSVLIGHPSAVSVRKAARQSSRDVENVRSLQESDWHPELRMALEDYARGNRVNFSGFELQLPPRTKFRDLVLAATRRLDYGQTTTYGDLARLVGHPGAARAVGTVMSTNRFPILIPCHRVLAAGGMLGGYTSPSGTELKQRLLDMERRF